jgi:Prolyl oligopeptidase family
VFVEGWSNGGFMAVHAVTTAPRTFAAAGEIESVLDLPVTTTQPVRIMHIQSVQDQIVPIGGGDSALLHGEFGRPVRLPSSYTEAKLLPVGSTWTLVTDEGTGPGHHGYQPIAAQQFWRFFAQTLGSP